LAALRSTLDSTKGQLRISQRAVESLGRQVEEQKEARERLRIENESTQSRLSRKERIAEDLLLRAQRAESELVRTKESEREAKAKAKSLESGTADAISRCDRAEREYDALRSSVRSMREAWQREVTALGQELEAAKSQFSRDTDDAKLKHHALVKLFQARAATNNDVQAALTARAEHDKKRAQQMLQLTTEIQKAVQLGDDSLSRAYEVAGELRRLRRLMREHRDDPSKGAR